MYKKLLPKTLTQPKNRKTKRSDCKNIANLSPVDKERLETKTDSRISKMGPKYKNLAKRFAKQIVKKHNQAKADAKKKES